MKNKINVTKFILYGISFSFNSCFLKERIILFITIPFQLKLIN